VRKKGHGVYAEKCGIVGFSARLLAIVSQRPLVLMFNSFIKSLSYLRAYASEGLTQHKHMNIFIFTDTPQLLVSLTFAVSPPLIVSKTNHPDHI
jgi:hypothetical protein